MQKYFKDLNPAPENINILGKLCKKDANNIVVIGSRTMSSYGKDVINYFVPKLVKEGITIISGMAPGCDSYAQEVALKNGGRTIGILGFGLNYINKDYNNSFIKKIIKDDNGVVISPFKRTQKPTRESFIYRNRVMAYMGRKILVIEASKKSGSFHTVNFGLDFGKDIFAIPGNIFRSQSMGTNNLIKEGAFLINNFSDL